MRQRQAHHGGDAAKPWHRIARQGLVLFGHDDSFSGGRPRSHSSTRSRLVVKTINKVATAAMVGEMFSRMPLNIWRGNVSCSGPARNSTTTTSSNDVANANNAPEITPGAMTGSVMRKKLRSGLSPRLKLARMRFWFEALQCRDDSRQHKGRAKRRVHDDQTGVAVSQAQRPQRRDRC